MPSYSVYSPGGGKYIYKLHQGRNGNSKAKDLMPEVPVSMSPGRHTKPIHIKNSAQRAQMKGSRLNRIASPNQRLANDMGGRYGQVRVVSLTPQIIAELEAMYTEELLPGYRIRDFQLYPGQTVAIKVVVWESYVENMRTAAEFKSAYEESFREIAIHHRLSSAEPIVIENVSFDSQPLVPRLYLGGVGRKHGLVVMEHIDGHPLYDILYKGNRSTRVIPTPLYVSLEKAFLTLMVHGISHNDLHVGNVLIKSRSPSNVVVIDFGLSVVLPARVTESIRKRVAEILQAKSFVNSNDILQIWQEHVRPVSNAVMTQRGYPEYHANALMLTQYYYPRVTNKSSLNYVRKSAYKPSMSLDYLSQQTGHLLKRIKRMIPVSAVVGNSQSLPSSGNSQTSIQGKLTRLLKRKFNSPNNSQLSAIRQSGSKQRRKRYRTAAK